ncbi:MAG: hypothetical protein DI598_05435 [Pseudopedobacter saltans]|uniref:Secretion system C-terminal sorting domain-containing protein n=1 Tax=Pseudopedobacter saltans TaxID=151895 RepID=A0A2W5F8D8_9SPHI|nr:MAG: hypothetical protein DI598_05435 [Pseudopedobacter saltans]
MKKFLHLLFTVSFCLIGGYLIAQKPTISLLGNTTAWVRGNATSNSGAGNGYISGSAVGVTNGQLPSFTWNIPSGTNRMMVLNFYFERDFRNGSDGGNWPSTYHSSGDYFDPFTLSVGTKTPTLIRAASASWRGDGKDKEITPDQAQFGAIMYRYVLSDANGLPSGNTTFDFSGIVAPNNAGDELAVSIEVYNNVSPIITYDNNYDGVAWMVANNNTAGANQQTNRNTFTMSAKQVTTPLGRSATDFWYEGFASDTKDHTITSNWNLINNVKVTNNISGQGLSANTGLPTIGNESDGSDMLISYTNGVSSAPSITLTRPNSDATYIMNARLSTLTLTPLAMPSISGNVYWDTDGPTNINGTGTNGDGLFVNVLDANSNVVYAATVASDGTYTIPAGYVIETYTYTLQLTKNKGTTSSSPPTTALNDGWVTVGESSSTTGNDGTANGLLSTGKIGTTNISGMNFGINNPTVLPITFSKPLWARLLDNSIILGWTTATEINNKYFDIQRSADSKNWTSIGTLNSFFANGNGDGHEYSFSDNKPLMTTNYYRLQQYDYDGKYSIGDVVSISREKVSFSLAPNPATSNITAMGIVAGSTIRIYNTSGQLVKEKLASAASETIEISSLPSGVYIVQIIAKDGKKQSSRFIKN